MKKAFQLFAILAVIALASSVMAKDKGGDGAAGDQPKPDLRGKITKIDVDVKLITFQTMGDNAQGVSVLVDDKTKITLDGADAKFTDLKVDMFIGVFGEADKVVTKINAFTKMPGGGKKKGGN